MTKPILQIQNISKKFQINKDRQPYLSLRDKISQSFSIKNLTKEEFWALKNISFDVAVGDSIGIIGKNGAGKSTLLKILSKITPPTSGKIISRGRIASLLEVGTGFHGELSGKENIFFNGSILGMKKIEIQKNFDAIVDFSGIEKFLETPLKHYSSGMQLRLAFAVAAFLENEILIIDEVLAVGDTAFQKKCMGKMEDLSKHGKTVIFVSHNMQSISRLCNRGIILEKGLLFKEGNMLDMTSLYLKSNLNSKVLSKSSTNSIQIENIVFSNEDSKNTDTFYTFEKIEIEVSGKAEINLNEVSIAICFNDIFENRITSLWSSYFGKTFDISEGRFKVIFTLPSFRLMPGDYEVISYIESKGIEVQQIDNFKKISVIYTNQYGYTVEPNVSQGYYIEQFNVDYIQS